MEAGSRVGEALAAAWSTIDRGNYRALRVFRCWRIQYRGGVPAEGNREGISQDDANTPFFNLLLKVGQLSQCLYSAVNIGGRKQPN